MLRIVKTPSSGTWIVTVPYSAILFAPSFVCSARNASVAFGLNRLTFSLNSCTRLSSRSTTGAFSIAASISTIKYSFCFLGVKAASSFLVRSTDISLPSGVVSTSTFSGVTSTFSFLASRVGSTIPSPSITSVRGNMGLGFSGLEGKGFAGFNSGYSARTDSGTGLLAAKASDTNAK